VDHRTDIWSLGVVLYEMISGRLPFRGEYEAAMMYSILNEDPEPLTSLRSNVPMDLERVVNKCLEKQAAHRYQHADDLLADLKRERKNTVEFMKPVAIKKRTSKKTKLTFVASAMVFVMSIIVAFYIFNRQTPKPTLLSHKQITFAGNVYCPAISPDGQFIAYVTGELGHEQKLMVQDLSGGQLLEIFSKIRIRTDADLRWSPDGSEFIFTSAGIGDLWGTFLVPRLGGSFRHIPTIGLSLCWSPDGSRIAGALSNNRISFLDKTTFDTTSISLGGSFIRLEGIDWSPLHNRLLFLTRDKKRYTIRTMKIDGSQQQQVVEDSVALFSPSWSADGEAIYYLKSTDPTKDLRKIKISTATGKAKAPPKIIQAGIQAGEYFSLSKNNKRALYTRELRYSNLWLVSFEGKGETQTIKTKQLTTGTSLIQQPRISPDEKSIAFRIERPPHANIFVMPMEGGSMQQLTFLNSYNAGAAWSPDGKEIAFGSTQGGKPKVWRINSNGGTPRPFEKSELRDEVSRLTWAPGSDIVYQPPENRNLLILNPKTEEERPLVANESLRHISSPRYSPDGKTVVVFGWPDTGLWLVSLKDSSPVLLHKRSALHPIEWSADGKWIYAWDLLKKPIEILMIPVNGGKPKTLVTLPFENIDRPDDITMTPDGKRLVCAVAISQSDIWMMENFDPAVE